MADISQIYKTKKDKELEAEALKWAYNQFYDEIKNAKVVGDPYKTQEQSQPKKKESKYDWSLKGWGRGIIDGFRGVVNGVQNALQSTLNFGTDITNFVTKPFGVKYDYYDMPKLNVDKTETLGGQITEAVTQFMTPTLPVNKVLKSANYSKMAVNYLSGVAGDLMAFDGNSGRLADVLNEVPVLKHIVPDVLTTKEDDSNLVGRAKNVAEGLLLGGLTDKFIDILSAGNKIKKIKSSLPKDLEDRVDLLKKEIESIDIETPEDKQQIEAIVDDLLGEDWETFKSYKHKEARLGDELPELNKKTVISSEDVSKEMSDKHLEETILKDKEYLLNLLDEYRKTVEKPKIVNDYLLYISDELNSTKALPFEERKALPYETKALPPSDVLPIELAGSDKNVVKYQIKTLEDYNGNKKQYIDFYKNKWTTEDNMKGYISMDMIRTFIPEIAGATSGLFVDYNKDGKIDYEDVGLGLLGSAGIHTLFVLGKKGAGVLFRKDKEAQTVFNTIKESKVEEINGLIKKLEDKKTTTTKPHIIAEIDKKIEEAIKLRDQVKNFTPEKLKKTYDSLINKEVIAEQKKPIIKINENDQRLNDFVRATINGDSVDDIPLEFNAKYISNIDDIEDVIKRTSSLFEKEIDKAKRGVQSFGNTVDKAEKYILDENTVNKTYSQVKELDAKVYAVRTILNSSAKQLSEMAELISQGKATAQDLVDFKHLISVHAGIQAQASGIKTEIARALNAMKITSSARVFSNERNISEIIKAFGGFEDITKLAEIISRASKIDNEVLNKTIKDTVIKNLTDMAFEVFVSNILSNVKTPVVNILSNTLAIFNNAVEELFSISYNKVFGDNTRTIFEFAPMFKGIIEGAKEGTLLFIKAFKTGLPQFDKALNPLELRTLYKSISSDTIRGMGEVGYKLMEYEGLAKAVDLMGEVLRFAQRPIIAGDDFFKAVNFRMSLNQTAYQKAYQDALNMGFSGKELFDKTEELFSKYIADPSEELMRKAKDTALDLTFSTPLSEKNTLITNIGEALQRASAKSPVLKFIVPFIRTPANLMEYTFERTPILQYISKSLWSDIVAGGTRRDTAMAKLTMGSMYGLLVYSLTENKLIMSGLDRSKQASTENGRLQYSIKLGDKYYNFSRLDPIGSILSIASDITFFTKHLTELTEDDQKEVSQLTTSFLRALANNITNKTYLKNLSDFLDALTSNEPKRWEKLATNLTRGFIPLSSLLGGIETAISPEYKELFAWSDAIKERIPFVSDSLINKRSLITGKVLQDEHPVATGVFLPTKIATKSNDPLLNELDRINLDFEQARPKMRKLFGIELTPKQYDLYVKTTGEKFHELASKAIKTETYQKLPTNLDAPLNKQAYLQKIFNIAKMYGQSEVMKTYKEDLVPKLKQKQELLRALQLSEDDEEL